MSKTLKMQHVWRSQQAFERLNEEISPGFMAKIGFLGDQTPLYECIAYHFVFIKSKSKARLPQVTLIRTG
jgi:hypothetical protein